jgi:iron complex outermembrane recepter protein
MPRIRFVLTRSSITTLALTALTALPFVARAQQGEQVGLQEVIVTATKRIENLQEVPFSVSATSQDQIRKYSAESLVDLSRNIASFTVADLGPGQSQMAIRGISSGQVIRDQPGLKEQVGVYLDESPISVALFTPDLELVDLDRFEVLRGPQGTLFGAGSEAGTVRYITHQPDLGKTEAFEDASFETVEHGGQGGMVRGVLNLPLGDITAMRLVVYWHHLPGFIDAIQPGGGLHSNVNDGDRTGLRLAFLIKPNDALSITPRVMFQNLTTNGFPHVDQYNILANPYTAVAPVTIGDREQYTQQREGLLDQFLLTDLKLDYNLGSTTLTSITSYTDRHVRVLRDATQLSGSVTYHPLFDTFGLVPAANLQADVRLNSPLYDRTALNVISEELRIASNGTQLIDWLVGGFFQHVDRHYGQDLPTPGYDAAIGITSASQGAPPDTPFYSDLSYTLKQYAAFGEATWHMTNKWALTAGLRYYKFNEDKNLLFAGVFSSPTCVPGTGTGPGNPCVFGVVPASTDSNGTSPRLILSYRPTDDVQFNAQAARGFRLGGINDPINLPLCTPQDRVLFGNQPNWKDEKLWDYELGMKSQWLGRRLTFNIAVFDEEITDLQANTTAGSCSSRIVFNVPTSRSAGVEAELFAKPNATWDLGLSGTYLDAKLTSSVIAPSTGQVVGGLADGNRLTTSPEFQASAFVGYTLPVSAGRDFFANLTLQYLGSSYSQFENEEPGFGEICTGCPNAAHPNANALYAFGGPLSTNSVTFNPELPSYSIGNLRFGLKTDRWQAAVYINNLWDETAHLALDYERGRSARFGYLTNQPRTYGLYGSYSF